MRKHFLVLAVVCLAAAWSPARSGDAFDFGDMPPLPPPLLDDGPNPPPLTPPPGPAFPSGAASLAPPAAPPVLSPLAPPPPSAPAAAVPVAGESGGGGRPEPTPDAPETPQPARIAGGRVNVRAGPNTQYESIAVLTTGAPVTVLAQNGEWYKIVYPGDQLASIHKNYVNAEISGDIPEAGAPGVVNQDNADVHAFYWDKSTVVGRLGKGDPVTIKQERGQWYRIAAPETARAYVFAEYVRVDGGRGVAVDSAPPPANPAIDLAQGQPDATGRLKLSENDRRAAAIKDAYFRRLQDQQVREEETASLAVRQLESAIGDLEERLKAIDSDAASRITYPVSATDLGSAAWAPPDPPYGGFTGWVENIGRVGGAPASFRLSRGGEVRFYLRSDRFTLSDYAGRRVWVNGPLEASPAGNVLNVEQIRYLTDQEIASGMFQGGAGFAGAAAFAGGPGGGAESSGFPPLSAPALSGDASNLPDTVGQGGYYASPPAYPPAPADASGLQGLIGSGGEVESDYFENPAVSEIGPE